MEHLLTDFIFGIRKYVLGISDESLALRRGLLNLYVHYIMHLIHKLNNCILFHLHVFNYSMWHINNFVNIMLGILVFILLMVAYYSIFEKGAGSQFFDEASDNIGALLSRAPLLKQLRGA